MHRGGRQPRLAALVVVAMLASTFVFAGAGPSGAFGTCDLAPCGFDDGAEVFNVKAFGAVGNTDADDTAAIEAANAAATAAKGIVFFPPGQYRFIRPLTVTASWHGAGVGDTWLIAKLKPADPPFPAGAHALTLDNPDRHLALYNVRVSGPAPGNSVKARTGDLHGVAVNTPATLRRVGVDHFEQGITFNSGRVVVEMGQAGENYVGLFVNTNEPGIFLTGSVFTGNAMASIASPAGVTMTRLRSDRVHLGNSVYALYQEAGTGPGWMDGVSLEQTAFEAIGNSAIFTENVADSVTSRVSNLYIASGGASFKGKNSAYGIATRPDDYAVVLGSTAGSIHITSALAEFPRHTVGNYSIRDNQGSVEVFRANMFARPPYDIAMAVGGRSDLVQLGIHNLRAQRSSSKIPAGSTSVVVASEYLGPAESIIPFVQPTGTGGSGQQLALVVSDVVSAASYRAANGAIIPGYTRFKVTAVGEVPITDVGFTWQIGDDLT